MNKKTSISRTIHNWILVSVLAAFAVATSVSFVMNTRMSRKSTENLLKTHLEDVCSAVHETDSLTILNSVIRWADYFNNFESFEPTSEFIRMVNNIAWGNDIDEICFINEKGIIESSNEEKYHGYDMASAEQSREFLILLRDSTVKTFIQELRAQGMNKATRMRYAASTFATHPGFIEIGIKEENYKKHILNLLEGSTRYRRIGDTGSIYIFAPDFHIISAPATCTDTISLGITRELLEAQEPSTIFQSEVRGEDCYCMYSIEQGCYVLAIQPISEATLTRNTAVYLSSATVFIIFIILFFIIWWLIRKLVVHNINKVNNSLTKITDGNLDEKVDVRDSYEFDSLSTDINKTVTRLKEYIHEAETRMDADLSLAKAIQLSALPSTFPAFPNRTDFDVFAGMLTAKEVGGDFYDFYFSDQDTFTITIADVAGKGIPAAMFMMRGKSTMKNIISTGMELETACNEINTSLCTNNDTNTFVTVWVAQINLTSGLMTFVNCGHNLPIVRHQNGKFEFAQCKPNLPLATFDAFQYEQETIQLQPGDEVFLYTDGVTEAANKNDELFGDERLIDTLNNIPLSKASSPQDICKYILSEVQDFANGTEQSDDITMLCFKYQGKQD